MSQHKYCVHILTFSVLVTQFQQNIFWQSYFHFDFFNSYFRVIAHSSENRMRAQNLAIVFGPTLLWPKVNDAGNVAMVTVYQAQLIEFLILECAKLFPRV